MSWQIALPLMLVVVAGFPHGAADGVLALRLAARGRVSLTLFMAAYLAIAGVVMALWWLAPLVGFVLFLALSVSHFGMMDTAATAHLPHRAARVAIHGAAPIMVVPLAHGAEVTAIFSLLVSGDVAALIDLLHLAAPVWALAVLWLALGQAHWPAGGGGDRRAGGDAGAAAAPVGVRGVFLRGAQCSPFTRGGARAQPAWARGVVAGGGLQRGQCRRRAGGGPMAGDR